MWDDIKRFLSGATEDDRSRTDFSADELRIATAGLLVHAATLDGPLKPAEHSRILSILEHRFRLEPADAVALLEEAEHRDRASIDLYVFTRVLNRDLGSDGRLKMIRMLWEVVYADGELGSFESNLMRRIGGLLGVSDRDRGIERKHVLDRLGIAET